MRADTRSHWSRDSTGLAGVRAPDVSFSSSSAFINRAVTVLSPCAGVAADFGRETDILRINVFSVISAKITPSPCNPS